MSAGSDKNKIEIDIAEEWTERIGKTANKYVMIQIIIA